MLFATPQRQVLTRREWPRELAAFLLRIFFGDRHRDLAWTAWAGLAWICWGAPLIAGFVRAAPRVRRLAIVLAFVLPIVTLVAGVAGGLPCGPPRYVSLAP